jgi:hypothetical protein
MALALELTADNALAFADQLISQHGVSLRLIGPEGGLWYADLSFPDDPNFGEGYIRASTRGEALRLAVERAAEMLGANAS